MSNTLILFDQSLKDLENLNKDIAKFDINFDDFENLCREAWEDDYNQFYIDRPGKKMEKKSYL